MPIFKLNREVVDQIEAMLAGRIVDYLRQKQPSINQYNFRLSLSVTKDCVTEYLTLHPEEADHYFAKWENIGIHDVERIWRVEKAFMVATMDNGKPRFSRSYRDLSAAVADHLLAANGIL